nr:hypothetical protein [Armatimonas sp.]
MKKTLIFLGGAIVLLCGCQPKDPLIQAAAPQKSDAVAAPPPGSAKESALPASLQPGMAVGKPGAAPR